MKKGTGAVCKDFKVTFEPPLSPPRSFPNRKGAVFCCRLARVAGFAQRLPVVRIPEQIFVATVWLDVVDFGGWRVQSFS